MQLGLSIRVRTVNAHGAPCVFGATVEAPRAEVISLMSVISGQLTALITGMRDYEYN